MATNMLAARSLALKYLESSRVRIMITTAAIIPAKVSDILYYFSGERIVGLSNFLYIQSCSD
jgi:hypothetical protein